MKELLTAIIQAQSEMPVFKRDMIVSFKTVKYKYVTLQTVLTEALPILQKNKILLTNAIVTDSLGTFVVVKLMHADTCDFISTAVPIVKNGSMQDLGSCITYAQRYGLLSLLGLAPDVDNDGANNDEDTLAKDTPAKDTPAKDTKLATQVYSLLSSCPNKELKSRIEAYGDLTLLDEVRLNAMLKKLNEELK
jgi:hypothetical protein